MMLDHLGERSAAQKIDAAVKAILAGDKVCTKDLDGSASTIDMGNAIAVKVRSI
jgi:isocitrate/isopropylmalate dehydrogenase